MRLRRLGVQGLTRRPKRCASLTMSGVVKATNPGLPKSLAADAYETATEERYSALIEWAALATRSPTVPLNMSRETPPNQGEALEVGKTSVVMEVRKMVVSSARADVLSSGNSCLLRMRVRHCNSILVRMHRNVEQEGNARQRIEE